MCDPFFDNHELFEFLNYCNGCIIASRKTELACVAYSLAFPKNESHYICRIDGSGFKYIYI